MHRRVRGMIRPTEHDPGDDPESGVDALPGQVPGTSAGPGDGRAPGPKVKPVFLQDFVDVHRPVADVRQQFCRSGDWLAPLARQAGDDGDTLLVRIDPTPVGIGWGLEVRVRLGDCSPLGDGASVPLRWEASHLPSLFPVLDGDIELAPLGPDECRLVLRASYRPPMERLGRVLDSVLLHRIAESTVRSFLRRVADSLEAGGMAPASSPVPSP